MKKNKLPKNSGYCLIVKCVPLDDQYECEADKTPLFICTEAEAIKNYGDKFGYEIYSIRADGLLKLEKEYDEGE